MIVDSNECGCLISLYIININKNSLRVLVDVLGRTRATLMISTSISPYQIWLGNLFKYHRAGDRLLQLLIFNEEFLVSASHQLALITSLPFVISYNSTGG